MIELSAACVISEDDNYEEIDDSDVDQLTAFDAQEKTRILGARPVKFEITNREQFTALLSEHESVTDLQRLYPRSLWDEECIGRHTPTESSVLEEKHGLTHQANLRKPCVPRETFIEITMSGFTIYNSVTSTQHPGQFESLHKVASQCRTTEMKFSMDGWISLQEQDAVEEETVFVSGMMISDVSIGGFGDVDIHTSRDHIWIQTIQSTAHHDVWYKLSQPAPEYLSVWEDDLWLADLSKHVVEYMEANGRAGLLVGIQMFNSDFKRFITDMHSGNTEFDSWLCATQVDDGFCKHVIRHRDPLFNEAYSLDKAKDQKKNGKYMPLLEHPLWQDIGLRPSRSGLIKNPAITPTTMTPHIAQGFRKAYPGWDSLNIIRQTPWSSNVNQSRESKRKILKLPDKYDNAPSESIVTSLYDRGKNPGAAKIDTDTLVHRVVLVGRGKDSRRLAFVLRVTGNKRHVRVIWLAAPWETICANTTSPLENYTKYPIHDELFFTDECNCSSVKISDIFSVHTVSLFTRQYDTELFINSRYLSDGKYLGHEDTKQIELAIVTARQSDLYIACQYGRCKRVKELMKTCHLELGSGPAITSKSSKVPKLLNLSLFSGCGLFDRALESKGDIETIVSVEYNEKAILSLQANNHNHDHEIIFGSVDDILLDYLQDKRPWITIDMCSAGSPCQGFSLLNTHKNNKNYERSQKNCSYLASSLSWVDLLLPGYVVLENVTGMDASPACAQAICQLVALGYQVRKCRLKACDLGGCTKRERLVLIAAAPDRKLPNEPPATHGGTNNLLDVVTAQAATIDLPPVDNDKQINVLIPDHIPLIRFKLELKHPAEATTSIRDIVRRIPADPPNQGLVNAYHLLTPSQKRWYRNYAKTQPQKLNPKSKILRRLHAHRPFPAIITTANWRDAFHSGETLHWEQDRCITLEEARRGQGVPGWFIIVGSLMEQLRAVGNAVPWALGEAIGTEIWKSWESSWDGGGILDANESDDEDEFKTSIEAETEDKIETSDIEAKDLMDLDPREPSDHRTAAPGSKNDPIAVDAKFEDTMEIDVQELPSRRSATLGSENHPIVLD